ncbi:hypothetical protein B6D25_05360 [Micrococcus luteus]|jgi:hypothetical protein|uniref:Hydrolase MSMEG_3995 n=1 Tax=Micrococcus luteus (strain ATCC 4698 / DSM 20030 / JCM 1464 / CCM 169 / CCUG 5858 / IAM 1056 / NBRC 3333 / NCIMB 9278 / NCTC 2665 / VKM Ac-2230) TaxID=465515 RepID=C5C7T6_MICLC|nr:hypothetical protein [Micrococcus luteus]ACS31774.1 hypothetical protein Mlut_23100 [Micrococcus luteus NCTC 2665]AJO56813.1 hypothetical protein BF96_11690 [Micrococcus luteus]KAB1899328.1 hypothetical protein F8198_10680 [Micrococcus luteus NCTC 2665]ORE61810.1 hypothetical protein B6D25_05360 [Micrococcus luteus]QCY45737.1 hypothetical protein ERB44_04210 [Micrococcus luteus]
MLFVPSVDGIPHEECELNSDEDVPADVELLTGVLARIVEGIWRGRDRQRGGQSRPRLAVLVSSEG